MSESSEADCVPSAPQHLTPESDLNTLAGKDGKRLDHNSERKPEC